MNNVKKNEFEYEKQQSKQNNVVNSPVQKNNNVNLVTDQNIAGNYSSVSKVVNKNDANAKPAVQKTNNSNSAVKQNIQNDFSSAFNKAQEKNNVNVQPTYQSQYDSQISGLVDKILNGEKFDYDVNSDAMFANYADVYERNAKKAAEDAMGRSAAASGGYGNSYASAMASQAYNSQMQNLNATVPELQNLAYQQYQAQKQDEYNQLSMLKGLEDSNYAKYRDSMSDFYTDREYTANREDAAWDKQFAQNQFDYSRQQDALAQENWNKQFDYAREQDALAQQNWQSEYNASREDAAWDKQFAQSQFDYSKQQDALAQENWNKQFDYTREQDALAQQNWQAEYNAIREDAAWDKQFAQNQFDANREDAAWDKQFAQNQFDYNKQQDAIAQENWETQFNAGREDAAWDKQFAQNQFDYNKQQDAKEMEFNKMVWENDSKMQEAIAAAELGDYSLLELYTGADLSSAKEDKNFANKLSMALSVYEATGSPKMLESLDIDTSYMDQILRYTLMEAQKSANGSSGGSGGGSYSGSGSSGSSREKTNTYSEPAVWGDKTAADIAAEIAYYYQGKGVAWNSRTVSDEIARRYPGLSIEAKHAINAYMADPDSGLEELMYTGMAPRK